MIVVLLLWMYCKVHDFVKTSGPAGWNHACAVGLDDILVHTKNRSYKMLSCLQAQMCSRWVNVQCVNLLLKAEERFLARYSTSKK